MSKVEINNEIVSIRYIVRQARVCVVNKLIREARNLRTRGKSEKQQERNKKRADRLIGEVYALKLIKDDEITKFGITNEKSLREILQTPSIDESTRIMARVVNYKSLRIRLDQFREQFPDYKKYVVPIKKKFTKKKPKIPKRLMKKLDDSKQSSSTDTKLTEENDSNINLILSEDVTKSIDDATSNNKTDEIKHVTKTLPNAEGNLDPCNLEPGSILRIKPTYTQVQEEQAKNKRSNKRKILSKDTDIKFEKKSETVRVINKEATVKRFTEVLQEESMDVEESAVEERDEKFIKTMPELEKEVDDFFMSASDGNKYHSVVVPKAESTKNMESIEQPHSRNVGDRFFSKMDKLDKPRWSASGNKQMLSGSSKNNPPIWKQKLEDRFNKKMKRECSQVANTEDENLHPSWAAKKKQQEIMKQGFQGKKIVFNDD